MKADGHVFRLSANRVWLVSSVPAKCERNQAHLAGRPQGQGRVQAADHVALSDKLVPALVNKMNKKETEDD